MRWASALSVRATTPEALDEVIADVRVGLGGERPQLLVVFSTLHHGLTWPDLPTRLRAAFPGARLVGCCGGGVLAAGQEIEQGAGLALTAAALPDVEMLPFRLSPRVVGARAEPSDAAVASAVGLSGDVDASVILLAEPFSCNVRGLVRTLDRVLPRATKVGGVVSGAREPGRHALFLDDALLTDGAVGVALYGGIALDPVVAQGCRPVGPALRVTRVRGPLLTGLEGGPALDRLQEAYDGLDSASRRRFQRAPMIGLAIDPAASRSGVGGDFLVRALTAVDPRRGGFAVGEEAREGDVVRLHIRDPLASVEDLQEVLHRYGRIHGRPEGALMFSCLGRGRRFYGRPDVDSRTVHEVLGDVPMGGFFCTGEIGPVHGRTWMHGYTASLALARAPTWN